MNTYGAAAALVITLLLPFPLPPAVGVRAAAQVVAGAATPSGAAEAPLASTHPVAEQSSEAVPAEAGAEEPTEVPAVAPPAPPAGPDGDGDALLDGAEAQLGTDPAVADTDDDGLRDGEELAGTVDSVAICDPLAPDADGDGLGDLRETEIGTLCFGADTDGDAVSDGDEAAAGADPLDAASRPDDGDGEAAMTVRARRCPPDGTTLDASAACTAPLPGLNLYTLAFGSDTTTDAGVTDGAGVVRLAAPSGRVIVGGSLGTDVVEVVAIACADETGAAIPVTPNPGGFIAELAAGDAVVCDYVAAVTEGDGLLAVNARLCPADLPDGDLAAACAEPLAGGTFSADAQAVQDEPPIRAVTDPAGAATFALPAGPILFWYEAAAGTPDPAVDWSATCRDPAGAPLPFRPDANLVGLDLTAGTTVTCDYYVLPRAEPVEPDAAALTVHGRLCPTAYAGSDYYGDCHATPLAGIGIAVEGPTSAADETDAAGDVRFANLEPGTYTITADIPYDFVERQRAFCAPASSPGTRFPSEEVGQRVRLALAAGDDVVCDLYVVGADARGEAPGQATASLTIHNRVCPPDATPGNFFGDCHDHPAPAGLEFSLEGPVSRTAETDDDGNVVFADLPTGTYAVRGGVPGEFASLHVSCALAYDVSIRFPFDPIRGGVRGPDDPTGIRLTLDGGGAQYAGDPVVCDWYNLPEDLRGGSTPTPRATATSTPPRVIAPPVAAGKRHLMITALPATGSGSLAGDAAGLASLLLLPCTVAAAVAVSAVARRHRERG